MAVVLLLALVLLAVAVASVVAAASVRRVRTVENLEQIDAYGYLARPESAPSGQRSARRRLDSVAAAIGEAIAGRISSMREEEIQRRLVAAGFFTVGARRFLGYQVLLGVAVPILLAWLLAAAGASVGAILLLVLVVACAGWVGPSSLLSRRARSRLEQVEDGLPELIDLLVVTIEAGVGFSASLRMAAERMTGPLGEELRLTLQEQSLGLSTVEALDNWLSRCETPALRSFVRAMVQGERLGVSIGQIMRNLALEMRKRRRQRAEERAQRAPIKILFPLVLLIFPAMFLIILGPALYQISDTFSGK